jgi:CheY-like chemotaxis protein
MNYLRRTGKYAELSGAPLPGLILLDLDMPKKDGWEVLREIKADPLLRAIPTIVLTTSKAPQNDILRAYDLGVSSFLVKPVTLLSLVDLALALSGLSEYWLEIVELTPRGLAA